MREELGVLGSSKLTHAGRTHPAFGTLPSRDCNSFRREIAVS